MRSIKSAFILAAMSAVTYASSKVTEIKQQDDLELAVNEKLKGSEKALLVTISDNSLSVNRIGLKEAELPEFLIHTVNATLESLPKDTQLAVLKRLSDLYFSKCDIPKQNEDPTQIEEDHH